MNRLSAIDLDQLCSVNGNESITRDFFSKISSVNTISKNSDLVAIQNDIVKNYKQKNFAQILKSFEKHFEHSKRINVNNFKILSDSIVADTVSKLFIKRPQ